jgi:phage gp29-like protein
LVEYKLNPNPQATEMEQKQANKTIEILNLNSPDHKSAREQLWDSLPSLLEKGHSVEELQYRFLGRYFLSLQSAA